MNLLKKLLISLTMLMVLVLAACGGNEESTTSSEEPKEEKVATSTEPKKEEVEDEKTDGEVTESEIGKLTVNYKNKELNKTHTAGPMNLAISAVQVSTLEVAEDYKEMFDNQDVVTVVTMDMSAENTTDDTVSFYPDQGTLVTDTGQQVEADLFLSGSVGGDFLGKVTLEDSVIWVLKHDENIKNLKLHIDGPVDTNFNTIAEELILEIPVAQ